MGNITIAWKDGRHLVEWNRGAEKGVDDVRVVVELLVHHQGQDAHLGGSAVVQLDRQLLVQGGLVPSGGLWQRQTTVDVNLRHVIVIG